MLMDSVTTIRPVTSNEHGTIHTLMTRPPNARLEHTKYRRVTNLYIPSNMPRSTNDIFVAHPMVPTVLIIILSTTKDTGTRITDGVFRRLTTIRASTNGILSFVRK